MENKTRMDWNKELHKVCPKCGKTYAGYPAVSRIDGTEICPECGVREALDAFAKYRSSNGKAPLK